MDETEAKSFLPKVVHVDADNRVVELGTDPASPPPGVAGNGLVRGMPGGYGPRVTLAGPVVGPPLATRLPSRLAAPVPGWELTADVCVVGSGVAGLCVALHARAAGLSVAVVTKVEVDDGSTRWAQGGIAAVLAATDSPAAHAADTETAGVGLCEPDAVHALVTEGPDRLRELMAWGAAFDRGPDGELLLTREGGTTPTGSCTPAATPRAPRCSGRCTPPSPPTPASPWSSTRWCSTWSPTPPAAPPGSPCTCWARAAPTASARCAPGPWCWPPAAWAGLRLDHQPSVSTGDGVALGLRAGAVATDLEFVQFHPTALYLGPDSRGQQPLVSEALRGEGALLRDAAGERFMVGVHPLAELAPRDVVAKAITRVQLRDGTDHVLLDARHVPGLEQRFPTIVARCREAGIDPVTELVPVTPRRTTPPAGWSPTSPAAPPSPASTPAARWPAPGCTGPTGWRRTRCSRAWSSPGASAPSSPPACPTRSRCRPRSRTWTGCWTPAPAAG